MYYRTVLIYSGSYYNRFDSLHCCIDIRRINFQIRATLVFPLWLNAKQICDSCKGLIKLIHKEITRLTSNSAIDTEPAWSVDGKKIIFTSDRAGSPQIYEMNIRTKLKRRLTVEGTYNARASFLNKDEIIFDLFWSDK